MDKLVKRCEESAPVFAVVFSVVLAVIILGAAIALTIMGPAHRH